MSYGTVQAEKMTTESGYSLGAGNASSFKNRLINGNMTIAQRGTTSVSANGSYPIDRWLIVGSQSSKFTAQQSSDAPTGFVNSVVFTSSSSYTVAGNDYFACYQQIEANNVSDLMLGTASAKTVTLSFWAKSSLTGSFGGSLQNSAEDRCYSYAYTINTANTWEYKTVTVALDTTGTWLTGTSCGIIVWFGLGATGSRVGTAGSWGSQSGAGLQPSGTVSLVGTSGATLYITGVQLEVGTVATSFDFRSYGTELALCQRYYYKLKADAAYSDFGSGYMATTNVADGIVSFPVTMRTRPTALEQSGTAADYAIISASGGAGARGICNAVPTWATATVNCSRVQFATATTFTSGWGSIIGAGNSTAGYLAWSAEL